jgi:hypothetical protein
VDVREQQRLALALGQPGERRRSLPRQLRVDGGRRLRRAVEGGARLVGRPRLVDETGARASLSAQLVERGAMRDRVQPRQRVGAAHVGRPRLVRLQERELQEVVGGRPIAHQAPQIAEEPRRNIFV